MVYNELNSDNLIKIQEYQAMSTTSVSECGVNDMEYISIAEAAIKWDISRRRVQVLCSQGRIPGLTKFGKSWTIPKEAEKPKDGRRLRKQVQG